MKRIFFPLFFIVSIIGYSQKQKITKHGSDTIEVISYHKNGKVQDSVWKTIEILVGKRDNIDPKHPGDSIVMNVETPFGTEKKYYKSGKIKSITYYGTHGAAHKTYQYRKKGSLAVYKETPYGLKKLYNKKGKQIRESDFNKNKIVRLSNSNKKHYHIKNSKYVNIPLEKNISFTNNTKILNIKSGAMFSVLFKNDTIPLRHCVLEGKSKDSLLLTKYSYDRSITKNKLKLDSTFLVSVNEIDCIYFATNRIKRTHFLGSFMQTAGFNMTFLPVIVVPLFAGIGNLSNPIVLGSVIAGVPVYICSKFVFKKTVPKKFKMSDWKIKS